MVQRYTLVRRARHGKRLPQVIDDPGNITRPITVTVTQVRPPVASPDPLTVVTPTVTVFVPPPSSLSSVIPTAITVTSINPSSSSSEVVKPIPSVTVNNNGVNTNGGVKDAGDKAKPSEPSSATSSSGTPTGAIIGIVLAVVLLLAAALVFWFRRRAVANRLRMRGWATKKKSAPSFLWIEPSQEAKGIAPYPATSVLQPNRGPPQPPMSHGSSWNGLAYIPPPPPPRPPPAASMYEYPASPPPVPGALTPGVGVGSPRLAPPTTAPPTPAPSQPVESATVRTAYIPTLSDELPISPGEVIRIHQAYDDGWALCSNARGDRGMVPLECLDRGGMTPNTTREFRKLARVSSLAAKAYTAYQ